MPSEQRPNGFYNCRACVSCDAPRRRRIEHKLIKLPPQQFEQQRRLRRYTDPYTCSEVDSPGLLDAFNVEFLRVRVVRVLERILYIQCWARASNQPAAAFAEASSAVGIWRESGGNLAGAMRDALCASGILQM